MTLRFRTCAHELVEASDPVSGLPRAATRPTSTACALGELSASQNPVYLDDIVLVAAAPPATVHVSVNATQTVRTVDAKVFGVNQVAWDGNLDTTPRSR